MSSTKVHCVPCQRSGRETTDKLSWCSDCAELMCYECAEFHRRFKPTVQHVIAEVTKEDAFDLTVSVKLPICTNHPDELISYFCQHHKTMCCKICLVMNHRRCNDLKGTDELGQTFKSTDRCKDFFDSMRKLDENIKLLKLALDASLEELRIEKEAVMLEIKEMRIQINAVLDSLETTIFDKFDDKHKQIYNQLNSDKVVLNKAESDTAMNYKVLNVNKVRATNTQFLLVKQEVETKQKDIEGKVKEVYNRGRRTLHLNLREITSVLKSVLKKQINDAPEVVVKTQPVSPVTESSLFTVVKEREQNSLFVAVHMFEDGRSIALDNSRSILRLLSNEHKETCQIFIKNAKQFVLLSRNFIVVCLDENEGLKLLKIVGTKLASNGEIRTNIKCFGMSKYQSSIILLCAKEQNDSECSVSFYPKEVTFKLLREDKTIVNFELPVRKPVSPWRGFLHNSLSNEFVAICEDGKSLMWIDKSGHIRQEREFEGIGRGGLSGLAVDNQGRLFVAATRKILEIGPNGQNKHTLKANINVYSIAVNEKGNKLIAVGHNNSMEVFTIGRIHPF